jgi:hypothetical protein
VVYPSWCFYFWIDPQQTGLACGANPAFTPWLAMLASATCRAILILA